MHRWTFVIGVCAASTGAAAQDLSESIATCKLLADSAQRLACFDKISAPATSTPKPAPSSDQAAEAAAALKAAMASGVWRVSHDISEIAGTKDVYLSVEGTTIRGKFGQHFRPSLWLRCAEKETNVLIEWGQYLGLDRARLEWRIDEEGPRTDAWHISSDREAVGLWSGGTAIPFIRTLIDKSKLAVRITPYGESPVTTTFPISGLRAAVTPLREACGWSEKAPTKPQSTPAGAGPLSKLR
jgi:type VI secretion system protein VasI